ncbi:hypothetical protein CEUSTIGMA_g11234.t1 [Chlamydomonas eustigma]|uniref:glycerophosphodiester phosphodiesterase n=1 Tax=Chlamydomonas eustigma TaxID=1157962 RepID=A0A250XLK1_9CHLO|nr:hypothetical protein CEUSTIGMA_g11234.t1 [Chlamydomonas eustigma]|eukprot:GAX83809.1 hypothetical protein CEUSTIGMA_g11234.t1 [Chlamydomonas eustigma]
MFSVIAHRGNSALAPENTLKAFDLALELGPAFELDVQLTSDNICIVLHDEKLGRTNIGSSQVADTSWTDLSTLDAGSWFGTEHADCRIPTLLQVLERYQSRAHIHLELKSQQAGLPEVVAGILRSTGWLEDAVTLNHSQASPASALEAPGRVTITSFHLDMLVLSMKLLPQTTHGWLIQEITDQTLEVAREAGISQLCPRVNVCSKELVDKALQQGFKTVRGWGVKNKDLLHHAVSCGMHGATVDWPHEALEELKIIKN